MIKKLILGMFAVAGLFATSCSSEDDLFVVSPDTAAQVTFDIDVEGVLATRAIGDASGINKLVYAVYDANGDILNIQGSDDNNQFVKTGAFTDLKESVAVTLAKGQKYTILFWAQAEECAAYNTEDLEAVAVDYATVNANNDETRDAFYAADTFEVTGDQKVKVTLKRPFAQVNLGVTSEDWAAAVASGIKIDSSKVVIKQAATTIDLKTGAVGDPVDVTYNFGAIPTDSLMVDTDGDGTNESYKYLSMSYILVNDDASTDGADNATVDVAYTFSPEKGSEITFSEGLNAVPVQRNYRTNIVGTILTGVATLDITIDPIFAGENIYPDGIEQEFEFAAKFGGTINLTQDVTLTKMVTVAKSMIINLNGYTLSYEGNDRMFKVGKDAILTVNGQKGTVAAESASCIATASVDGTIIINGGNHTANGGTLYNADGGTVIINKGYFNADEAGVAAEGTKNTLNIETSGNIIVKGGSFYGYNPANSESESPAVNFVVDGYNTIKDGDTYVVVH